MKFSLTGLAIYKAILWLSKRGEEYRITSDISGNSGKRDKNRSSHKEPQSDLYNDP